MSNVRDTSIDAYHDMEKELGERQKLVLEYIKTKGESNNLMISRGLGFPINTITGRTMELREMGLIKETGKKPCPITGRKTIFMEAI